MSEQIERNSFTIRIPNRYARQVSRLSDKDKAYIFTELFKLSFGEDISLRNDSAGDVLDLIWRDCVQMAKKNGRFDGNSIGNILATMSGNIPPTMSGSEVKGSEVKGSEVKGSEKNTMSEKSDLESFDLFRKKYQGKKRGNETEFLDFKKHKDWKTVLPLLEFSIDKQILARESLLSHKKFVPEWKNLKTWINQRCWEEEVIVEEKKKFISVFDKAMQHES